MPFKTSLHRIPSPVPAGILVASLNAIPSFATEPGALSAAGELIQLPANQVTATKTERDSMEVPYHVDTITSLQLQEYQPRTFAESLKYLPSVMVQKTGHGQGSPFLRGFTGFRTLMLVDGIRLNNSTFRDGPNQYWNTVDPLSLKRIEVVRGPSSVLYGSDAIGGTVNAMTLDTPASTDSADPGGRAVYRASSAEASQTARGEFELGTPSGWSVLGGGSWKDYGDVRGGGDLGVQSHTGYLDRAWDAKVQYELNPGTRIVMAHQTVDQNDAWRVHSTKYGVAWEGLLRGTDLKRAFDQNRDLTYVQLHATKLQGFAEEVHFNLSHHWQREEEHQIRSNLQSVRQGVEVHTLGSFLQLKSPSRLGTFVYGVEYYRDWVNSNSRRYLANGNLDRIEVQGPVADDASYDLAAVYLEDNIPLGERLELTLGGRLNYAGLEADRVKHPTDSTRAIQLNDSWTSLVGSGRILWKIDERARWNLYAGVSQGFRAPNLSDLTRFDIAASGELEVPSPGLEPERFVTYEGGVKLNFERIGIQAGYYYTQIENQIIRTPTGQTINLQGANLIEVLKSNSGDGYIHGIELNGIWQFAEQWSARSAVTWMEGGLEVYPGRSLERREEPVTKLMPTTLDLALRWSSPWRGFWAEFGGTIASRQNDLSSADLRDNQRIPAAGTPGYSVLNLRLGANPWKRVHVTAAIENLTDEDYRIHGSGVNEPGRNFIFATEIRF